MTVVPIRKIPPSPKFTHTACAQSLEVCRAHLLIIASQVLEKDEGKIAKRLTELASYIKYMADDIMPPTMRTSTANECLERP